ncbi:MAG TPA: alginate lyase family protein [Terriglobales bacterium]|nr:alginate lyase family protein [Terriglobales bacterium]
MQRKFLRARRMAQLASDSCPVSYRYIGYYRPQLSLVGDASAKVILETADAVCRGQFSFFGYDAAQLGFPPTWNRDFVSGLDWNDAPSAELCYIRHDGSDVKVPWELSRLQFAPVLAKAHRLSGEERYRDAAKKMIGSWIEQNAVGRGVNWAIAMEAALRGLSMCFTLDLLWPLRDDEQEWLSRVTRSLWEHLLFIEGNLEFSHITRGNHYLSNIVGLLCLSLFLDGKPVVSRRRIYQGKVEREMQLQVYPDGCGFEASTGYHVLVLQMFTSALLAMRAAGCRPSDDFEKRLYRMYDFVSQLADGSGQIAQAGDCDDGHVELTTDDLIQLALPGVQRHSISCANLIGIGEALQGKNSGRSAMDDAAWYVATTRVENTESHRNRCTVFPRGGIAIVRSDDAELAFFNMPNGIAGKGSHTHNDKLSFVLKLWGSEVFCDSGTGCYTRDFKMRNGFRDTRAHNTLMLDGCEQNRFSTDPQYLFCMGNEATVEPITAEESADEVLLRSSHAGYRSLGVTHSRLIRLSTLRPELIIEDVLEGSGEHGFELFFHVPAHWQVGKPAMNGGVASCTIGGARTVSLEVSASETAISARTEATRQSVAYGAVRPASRIVIAGSAKLPTCIRTVISWSP